MLADRNTVAIGAVDIQLDFGAYPCQVYGRVCFLHPLHNFALVAFDPRKLPAEVCGVGCMVGGGWGGWWVGCVTVSMCGVGGCSVCCFHVQYIQHS